MKRRWSFGVFLVSRIGEGIRPARHFASPRVLLRCFFVKCLYFFLNVHYLNVLAVLAGKAPRRLSVRGLLLFMLFEFVFGVDEVVIV